MPSQFPLISINGVLGASISPLDRGFAYGDGLFETCRFSAGKAPLWDFHCDRLMQGCHTLMIPLDITRLESHCAELLQIADSMNVAEGILKIVITRGEGGRGYMPPTHVMPTLCVLLYDSVPESTQGIAVRICQQRISSGQTLAGIKHLNRLEQILARAEWQDERYQEGLLLNENGNVIEATASNLFIVSKGQLITPDLSRSGVAGILRKIILERLAPALRIPIVIMDITTADLWNADEVFLCNSVKGIMSVAKIDGEQSIAFADGEITRALNEQLSHFMQLQGLPNGVRG